MTQFLSPYPLSECVLRMKQLQKGNNLRIQSTRVMIYRLDERTYNYRIRRWEYFNLVAEMSGKLTIHDEKTTDVIGQARISLHLRLTFVVSLCICALGTASYINSQRYDLLPFWGIGFGWAIMVWFFWSRWRNALTESVERILS
jgi:hypothetical protein